MGKEEVVTRGYKIVSQEKGDLCKIFLFFKILKFAFTKFIFLK